MISVTRLQAFAGVSAALCLMGVLSLADKARADMIDTSGMKPWEVCALCHSLNGISPMAKFPKLAGQKAAYIEKQLRDFRAGHRSNDGGAMEAIVTGELAEENIPVVADYFSKLPAPPADPSGGEELKDAKKLFETGDEARSIPACVSCHVENNKDLPLAPRITAQHSAYVEKQLRDFKSGERANDERMVMRDIAKALSDEDISQLAQFIAAQPRRKQ